MKRLLLLLATSSFVAAACGDTSDPGSATRDSGVDIPIDLIVDPTQSTYDVSGDWLMLRHSYGSPSAELPLAPDLSETRFTQAGTTFTQYFGAADTEGAGGTVSGADYVQTDGTYRAEFTLSDADHGSGSYADGAFVFDFELVRVGTPTYELAGEWVDPSSVETEVGFSGTPVDLLFTFGDTTYRGTMTRDTGFFVATPQPTNGSASVRIDWTGPSNAEVVFQRTSWIPTGTGHTARTVTTENTTLVGETSGTTGALRVLVESTGDFEDPDGYVLYVGGNARNVDTNDDQNFDDLAAGEIDVRLDGIDSHCVVAGDNPRRATVVAGQTIDTTFAVSCNDDCTVGLSSCGDECVDTAVSRMHCEICDSACGPGFACIDSDCAPIPMLSQPLVWLDFANNLRDRGLGGHDGTVRDGEPVFDSIDGSSQALVFDGSTRVDLGFPGDITVATDESFTISMFIRRGESDGTGQLFATAPPGGPSSTEPTATLYVRPDGTVVWDYYFIGALAAGTAPLDTWTFVSVTVDGASGQQTLRLAPQGGSPQSATSTMVTTGADGPVGAGSVSLGAGDIGEWGAYVGFIDDFAYFNRVLSPEELDAIAGSTPAVCFDGSTQCGISPSEDGCDSSPCAAGVSCTNRPGESPAYECGDCPAGTTGNGEVCDDVDGCEGDPCYTGVACTDVPAPGTGFDCDDCPAGTTGNGITCTAVACEPACAGWQTCSSGSCVPSRCSSQGQCPGGYCFEGTCRGDGSCAARCSAVYGGGHTWACINEGYCFIDDCSLASRDCASGQDCVSDPDNNTRGPGGAGLFDKTCVSGGSSPCGGTCSTLCSATSGSCL